MPLIQKHNYFHLYFKWGCIGGDKEREEGNTRRTLNVNKVTTGPPGQGNTVGDVGEEVDNNTDGSANKYLDVIWDVSDKSDGEQYAKEVYLPGYILTPEDLWICKFYGDWVN